MNNVNLTGKIIRIKDCGKVLYATILCKNTKKENEYIPVTIFQTDFFNKYFSENQWISIQGHIHINKTANGNYITEIIVNDMFFCGDKTSNEFTEAEIKDLPWEV